MNDIKINVRGRDYAIPNCWEALTPEIWLRFVGEYLKVEAGHLTIGELRIRLLCDIMNWRWRKITNEEAVCVLIVLSEQLTFPFKIQYPDNNAALRKLSNEEYALAVRTEPEHLDIPAAKELRKLDWHYELDLCFFHQMLPTVTLDRLPFWGYKADNHHGALSTNLTALQYIEATEALKNGNLPWLASILYAPEPYNSSQAHALAEDFERLPEETLTAIRLNFMAVQNFLFTKTECSLLTKFEQGKAKAITTDMSDALYDLSKEGLGNASEVEQLNLLTYLRILRKRTIDAVRQLNGMKMEPDKIAAEVGLPIEVVTKII